MMAEEENDVECNQNSAGGDNLVASTAAMDP